MARVRDLQDQIVKATLNNNMKLVYKLQNQLVCSFEGRAISIRRILTNTGGKTPGIDNIAWKNPTDAFKAIEELGTITKNPNKYKSSPLKRVMIPKSNSTELRPLGIPTLKDRAVQAVYHMAVDPVVETRSDFNSYGFRTGRSQHDAIAYIRSWLDKSYSPEYILETDIAKCFDKICHDFIMNNTPICHKHILKEWLKSGYIFEGEYYDTTEGTPQGGIISPMLCNVALNGIEKEIRKIYPVNKTVKGGKPKVYISRFADDLIVTGKDTQTLTEAKEIIQNFLKIRGLELKEAKTKIVSIYEGFNFLGFNISRKKTNPKLNNTTKQETILIIKPADKAVKSIQTKIKQIIRKKRNSMASLIKELNPILRGWSNYFKVSYHSQKTFIRLGHLVWQQMMLWVKRKHPRRSIKKAIKNYIITGKNESNYKWIWGVPKRVEDTNKNKLIISNISETKITKYPLLKLNRNPYLLADKEYFEQRIIQKNSAKFREAIYKKFNHLCSHCKESLHNGELVELHHIIPANVGGTYTMNNIQPLHQVCHISITHNKEVICK